MMIRSYIRLGSFERLFISLIAGWLALIVTSSQAQTILNVTNFGARGDAVQFYVNTTSNSAVVTTTNHLSSADIGKAIEVFGVGTQTYGKNSYGVTNYGNQDLVATITNVVNGTKIYLDQIPQLTTNNTFATYGTDNETAFSNTIAAASGTNTVINIPSGKYLFLSSPNGSSYGYASVWISRGGIHFVGAGMTNTVLLSQGAWKLRPSVVWRGWLFAFLSPIINDYPSSIENLTMDGGLQVGNMSATLPPGEYANTVDGLGWDGTSSAIVLSGGGGNQLTHQTWTNVMFTHWRGEMVKSIDASTNGNVSIVNCVFNDGNASCINLASSVNESNNVFENTFFVQEYYQAYATNTSYFQNNLVTNMFAGISINGGSGKNPPFIIQNNTFYFQTGGNGIGTTPADNVYIISNQFICTGYVVVFDIGESGSQGTFGNSNIVIAANTIINPFIFVEIGGSSGYDPTNENAVENVSVYGNTLEQPNHVLTFLGSYGWVTNIHFFNNNVSGYETNGLVINQDQSHHASPFALIDTNNNYYTHLSDATGVTNYICYANGSKYEVTNAFHAGTVYALTDTNASQIPPGAQMLIYNETSGSASILVYLNSALTVGPIMVANGQTLTANWNGLQWTTNSLADALPAPIGLAIQLQ